MDTAHQPLIWHTNILPTDTSKALNYLGKQEWLKRSAWYLAGGTALALQAGHRSSVDLDFFSKKTDFQPAKLTAHFPASAWQTDFVREGTVYGKLNGAKVSFIAYPFFVPKQTWLWYGCVRVMDARDIAVMKIVAISQRGRKRDFVDLYWYCQRRESLLAVVTRLPDQYPNVAHDYHHILKSLTYFVDAEADPMPMLKFSANWNEIKKFFQKEVKAVAMDVLRLGK